MTQCVRRSTLLLLVSLLSAAYSIPAVAQNATAPPAVRPIPGTGRPVPAEMREKLQARLGELTAEIANLERRRDLRTAKLLPDVQIFSEAVRKALEDDVFFGEKDPQHALELLEIGLQRAAELRNGKQSWTSQTGLVVRGYRSRIDGSVQPYGLVIGADVQPAGQPVRCDIWFRGRSEKGLELQFLYDRLHGKGEYQLAKGIVLHPFGRYCNANRFAGEVDTFEALANVQENYKVDSNRISVRGFSMGGAACWDFTVHYPCKWFAANPGAGFSETRQFLGMDKNPTLLPPEYQQRMWSLYDADVLADNLFNTHVVAYSGEIDGQKKAADIMVAAAEKRGLKFPYIIGPQTAHKLHPDSKKLIAEQMDEWAKTGRAQRRTSVHFSTFSLKYNHCDWLTLNGLEEHWQEAYVDGDVTGQAPIERTLALKTRNVTDFTVDFTKDNSPLQAGEQVLLTVDGQAMEKFTATQDGSAQLRFQKLTSGWKQIDVKAQDATSLVKRHNLQGPVDDALMDSFLFVEPTGEFINPSVKNWVQSEQARAIREWRRQMRGDVRIKKDTDVTPEDIRQHHLILWGCPGSNQILKQVAGQLPIKWSGESLVAGSQKFDPAQQALILIHPNPLNTQRYIVLNSGLTYREADYLNNARQTPKIPDWAIVDFSEKPTEYTPGKIVAADFFDEHWQLKPVKK